MLFKRFIFSAVAFFLIGIGFYFIGNFSLDISSGDTYYVIYFPHLFFAAGISMIVPGVLLLYIELIQKKLPPPKLTKISFTLHFGGLLILLTTMFFPYTVENTRWISTINMFVYAGLFITVAGMSIIPAVLLISLRKSSRN
ncbi:MAG: hypothetical protein ACRC3B_03130 [Bacteroidia bacterium]